MLCSQSRAVSRSFWRSSVAHPTSGALTSCEPVDVSLAVPILPSLVSFEALSIKELDGLRDHGKTLQVCLLPLDNITPAVLSVDGHANENKLSSLWAHNKQHAMYVAR